MKTKIQYFSSIEKQNKRVVIIHYFILILCFLAIIMRKVIEGGGREREGEIEIERTTER